MGNPAFDPEFRSDAGYRPDTTDYGLFWLLKCGSDPEGWVRLWSGNYEIDLPADPFDTTGGAYLPVGMPGGLPVIDQVFNGEYVSGVFALSGVDATAVRLLQVDRAIVPGSDIHLGLQDFGSNGGPIGDCDWLGRARAGKLGFSRQAGERGATHTITLPFVAGFYDRNQGQFAVHSAESQHRRSPGDAGCDQQARISAGMILKWPATE